MTEEPFDLAGTTLALLTALAADGLYGGHDMLEMLEDPTEIESVACVLGTLLLHEWESREVAPIGEHLERVVLLLAERPMDGRT